MKKIISAITSVLTLTLGSVALAAGFDLGGTISPKPLSEVTPTVTSVLGTMQWIGYVVAVGMIIFVGIKYVTSGAGEKAKAKETLIPIVIGAVLIAAAATIAGAVFNGVSA